TGVKEDVTDIILNLKGVALKMEDEGVKRFNLRATGPAVVRAGDISVAGDAAVLNPDHVICTLAKRTEIDMELFVENGKGYVPADKHNNDHKAIGFIAIDSLFSPVRKVSYHVEKTREGQVLDYDKLTLTVETNGAVTPEDAVAYAARILQDQISIFINFS